MNVSLYQAAAALDANVRWQEAIAENLAAASVPGHKKQEISFSQIQAGFMTQPSGPAQPVTLPTATTGINFRQGELKFTGSKTDLAVEGPGFLAVQLPDGREAYTRDGEFRIDPFGQIITKQGYPVLGNGGTLQIDLNNPAPLSIAATGEIAQGADLLGRVRLTEFDNPQLLTPAAGGLFFADHPNLGFQDAQSTTVRQGYLEASNASSMTEMSQLITALRAYEANQRVIQVQDERTGRLITELGNPG